jgi:IS1 family transposase
MNALPIEKQVEIISALTEGCSIRAVERLTGTHRDTVMRLGVRVGQGCTWVHDRLYRNLNVPLIELDEVWSYVGKKQRRITPADGQDKGDQYIYTALDSVHKSILAYQVGKRDRENTQIFAADLRQRVLNRPQISSDGFHAYPDAIEQAFGLDVDYGQIVKHYRGEPPVTAARRYSPGVIVGIEKMVRSGKPDRSRISTSLIERSNLTLRMQSRRFTRLSNGFSKKLENHRAAVALFVAHYNLCRVHETIRCTPAMALGVADHIWTIAELIEAASQPELIPVRLPAFSLIRGGLS